MTTITMTISENPASNATHALRPVLIVVVAAKIAVAALLVTTVNLASPMQQNPVLPGSILQSQVSPSLVLADLQ